MLCGEVDRRDEAIRRLQREREALAERISALDVTMTMFEPRLDTGAAGTVRAIAGRYGPRGGLTSFVLEQLRAAGESGLDTKVLVERCAVRFKVALDEHPNVRSFKDTIRWSLRFLAKCSLIELVSEARGPYHPQVWRAASGPTFTDLLAQQEAVDDQDTDSP